MAGNTKLQLEISINYAENIESLNKEIEAMSKLPSLSKLKLGIDEDYIRDAVQNALNAKTFGIKVDPNISGGASGASGTPGGTKPPSSYQQQRNKIKLDSLNQEMIDQRRAKRQLADQKQLQQAYKFEIQQAKQKISLEDKLWGTAKVDAYKNQITTITSKISGLKQVQTTLFDNGNIRSDKFQAMSDGITNADAAAAKLQTSLGSVLTIQGQIDALNQKKATIKADASLTDEQKTKSIASLNAQILAKTTELSKAQNNFNDQISVTEKYLKDVNSEQRSLAAEITKAQKTANSAGAYQESLNRVVDKYGGDKKRILGYDNIVSDIEQLNQIAQAGVNYQNLTTVQELYDRISKAIADAAFKASELNKEIQYGDYSRLERNIRNFDTMKYNIETFKGRVGSLTGDRASQFTDEIKNIEELATAVEKFRTANGDGTYKVNIDETNAEDAAKTYYSLSDALIKARAHLGEVSQEARNTSGMNNASSAVASLRFQLDKIVEASPKLRNNEYAMADYQALLGDLNTSYVDSGEKMAEVKARAKELTSVWQEQGLVSDSLAQRVSKLVGNFSFDTIVRKASLMIPRFFSQMLTYVKELDAAMTELKKVTDETAITYQNFLRGASDTAASIGTSLKDVVSATADFARLGYSIGDASKLAEAALVYNNVGDGVEDVNQASESLISTMKAFGIEANDVIGIVDVFNEVGNNFAISSSGVGDALTRSASSLSAANNTLAESVALITTANSIVQDPESVGTSMKTLAMRLRGAKTELQDAGEDIDGMVESVSTLQSKLLALSHGKVNIMIDSSTFKSTYQIIKEMSEAWQDMTDIERAAALELMGGKRQANVLSALITNFQTAEAVIETASNSAGSAMKENERYLDSIQGHMAQLTTAFQTLSVDVINSGVVKFVVDVGTGLLKTLDALQRVGALLPVVLTSLSAIVMKKRELNLENTTKKISELVGVISKDGLTSYAKASINSMSQRQKNILASLIQADDTLSDSSKKAVMGLKSMKDASVDAAMTAEKLASTTKFVNAAVLIASIALEAVVLAYNNYKKKQEEIIQNVREAKEAYEQSEKTLNNNKKSIESLREEYDKLATGIDENGKNVGLTADEYDRYWEIVSQIVDISPSIVKGYDNERRAIIDYKNAINDAISSQEQLNEQKQRDYIGTGKDIFSTSKTGRKDAEKDFVDVVEKFYSDWVKGSGDSYARNIITGVLEKLTVESGGTWSEPLELWVGSDWSGALNAYNIGKLYAEGIPDFDKLMEYIENEFYGALDEASSGGLVSKVASLKVDLQKIRTAYRDITEQTDEMHEYFKVYSTSEYGGKEQFSILDTIPTGSLDEYYNLVKKINATEFDFSEYINKAANAAREFSYILKSDVGSNMESLHQQLQDGEIGIEDYNAELSKAAENLYSKFDSDTVGAVIEYWESLSNIDTGSIDDLGTKTSAISDATKKFKDNVDLLTNAWKESEEQGYVSEDLYQQLSDAGEDYLKVLDLTENGYKVNKESLKGLVKTMRENAAASILAEGGTNDNVRSLTSMTAKLYGATGQYDELRKSVVEYTDKIAELYDMQDKITEGYVYTDAEMLSLIADNSELVGYIEQVTGGWKLQEGAVDALADKYKKLALEANNAIKQMKESEFLDRYKRNANTISGIDAMLAEYEKNYGKKAVTMSDFATAYNDEWGSGKFESVEQWVDGYLDIVQTRLDENIILSMDVGNQNPLDKGKKYSEDKDLWRQQYDNRVKELEYLHKIGLKSEEKYYKELEALNERYFGESARSIHDPTGEKDYLDTWRNNYASYYEWKKDKEDEDFEWREYQLQRETQSNLKLIALYKEWRQELSARKKEMLDSGIYTESDEEIKEIIRQEDELIDKIHQEKQAIADRNEEAEKRRKDYILGGFDNRSYIIEYNVKTNLIGKEEALQEYKDLCDSIEKALQEAYAKGLDLTDEYVQSLISKLDSAKSAMASMYDGVIESFASQIEMNDTIASITGVSANSQNMTVLKGEEKYINTAYNAGLIDTNQYINDMTKNLQNQYKAISDAAKETQQNAVDSIKKQKEALQGVIDSLEELKSNYESAASAVSAFIDKQRGYAQEQLDASKALQAAIVKQIDLEKEELETLKEQAETRKGDMETAANAVVAYIDERINALKEENDELDRQKQIEEALLELERLKNQRNKRVYREGVGFVWESDQAAIDEAQTKYDNLVSENEKQKQIDDLEAYKKAWQEALDAYTQAADAEKAISVFGDNWKGFVESLDYEAIAKFGEEYSDVQQYIEVDLASQIDLLEKQAEAWGNVLDLNDEINQYEEQLGILNQFTSASEAERWHIFDEFSAKFAEDTRILQAWDDYKTKWEEATSAYEEDIERQHAASILGADWEQAILEQRTDIIDNWATGYKKVSDDIIYNQEVQMAELDALEESWASCFDGISGTMDTSLMQMKFFTDEYNAALESIAANLAKLSDLKLAGIEGGVIDKMKANSAEWNDIQAKINAIDKEIEKADYTIGLEWDAEDVENAKADKKRLLAEREELIRQQKELEDSNLLLGTSAGLTRDDASGVWYRSDGSNAYEARDTSDLTNISSTGNSFFDFALGKGAYANDAALLGKEDVVSTAAGNLKTTSTGWQVKSAQENTFDIGDIIIQSCNDSDELAKDIMKNLGNAMIQLMNRK